MFVVLGDRRRHGSVRDSFARVVGDRRQPGQRTRQLRPSAPARRRVGPRSSRKRAWRSPHSPNRTEDVMKDRGDDDQRKARGQQPDTCAGQNTGRWPGADARWNWPVA